MNKRVFMLGTPVGRDFTRQRSLILFARSFACAPIRSVRWFFPHVYFCACSSMSTLVRSRYLTVRPPNDRSRGDDAAMLISTPPARRSGSFSFPLLLATNIFTSRPEQLSFCCFFNFFWIFQPPFEVPSRLQPSQPPAFRRISVLIFNELRQNRGNSERRNLVLATEPALAS
jgi:hypothetical protein